MDDNCFVAAAYHFSGAFRCLPPGPASLARGGEARRVGNLLTTNGDMQTGLLP